MSTRAPWFYVALVPEGGQGELVDLTPRVLTFEYEDHESKTDKLRLTVNNFDLSNFDDPVFRHGARLNVSWGNGVDSAPMREVVVRKVTGGIVLNVEGDDRAVEMDTQKKRRTFENVSRSDIVRTIATENGWAQPTIEDTDEVFFAVNQANLTDAQMLRKLAALEGFEFFVDFDGLHWHRRKTDQAPARTLTYYAANPEAAGEIISFNVENDITRKPGRVKVKSRDPMTKEDIEATADNVADKERTSLQAYIGFIDPETGNFTKQKRVAQETTVGSGAGGNAPQTQADAMREAKGRFRKAAQTAVKMNIEIRGLPSLLAKTVVNIDGLGKRLSGKYYARVVKHSIDGQGGGYTCSAELITDGYGGGYGSKKGADGDGDATLLACIEELKQAQSTILGLTALEVQIDASITSLLNSMRTVLGSSGASRATAAQAAARYASKIAQSAAAAGLVDVQQAAYSCASVLRRISAVDDAKAAGNVNDKDETEGGQKVPVKRIDPETGLAVTVYVDKRGP